MSEALSSFLDTGPAPAYDTVHARLLRFFGDLVREGGGDPVALVARLGFDPQILDSGAAPYRQVVPLLEAAAAELGCPDFGMRLALRQGASAMFGPAGEAMRTAATFGQALAFATTHTYAHSLAAGIWMRPSRGGQMVTVGHDILLGGLPSRTQIIEQLLLLGHLMALELTGARVRARRILFRHPPASSQATYRRYFGCEVRFGQRADAAVYAAHDLECPVVAGDPAAYRRAMIEIEARFPERLAPLHARTRGIISHFLGTPSCTRLGVAAELGLHPRTMDRRLEAEGASFRALKDAVRRDLMLHLLESTDLDLARVSERLGFAEQSVMSRICRTWFRLSPRELRKRRRTQSVPV